MVSFGNDSVYDAEWVEEVEKKTPFSKSLSRSRLWWWLSVLILPFGICLLLVVRIEQWKLGYALGKLEKQTAVLRDLERQLRVEKATLSRPDRIAHIAQEKLGLSMPSLKQHIFMPYMPDKGEGK